MAKNGEPVSAWVFDSFDFEWDEEAMIEELLQWEGNIFSSINMWIVDHTTEWKKIKTEIEKLKHEIKLKINKWWNIPNAMDIEKIVNDVAWKINIILINNWFWIDWKPCWIVNKIASMVSYRTLIYRILKVLVATWFDTKSVKPVNVPHETWKVIYDIIKDPVLTTFLIVLKSYWIIDISENMWNVFEDQLEEELKICNIWEVKDQVIDELVDLWALKSFEWTVEDIYIDYPDKRLKKRFLSSFRTRSKTTLELERSFYYTIKRAVTDEEKKILIKKEVIRERKVWKTRICKEQEFKIDIDIFNKAMNIFWLVLRKRKVKERISFHYSKEWMKVDVDKYPWKQWIAEFEAEMNSNILDVLEKVKLDDEKKYPRMATWSWEFMRNSLTDEPQK